MLCWQSPYMASQSKSHAVERVFGVFLSPTPRYGLENFYCRQLAVSRNQIPCQHECGETTPVPQAREIFLGFSPVFIFSRPREMAERARANGHAVVERTTVRSKKQELVDPSGVGRFWGSCSAQPWMEQLVTYVKLLYTVSCTWYSSEPEYHGIPIVVGSEFPLTSSNNSCIILHLLCFDFAPKSASRLKVSWQEV